MVWCLCCGRRDDTPVCRQCFRQEASPPPRKLEGGLEVRSAMIHRGAARRLVLRLKYQGCREAAQVLAAIMAPLVPSHAAVLVPIPRIHLRRIRFGGDPALLLAQALSRRCGLTVSRALSPQALGSANAGRPRSARMATFHSRRTPSGAVVLVDDVITTGTTLQSAAEALDRAQIRAGITATVSV